MTSNLSSVIWHMVSPIFSETEAKVKALLEESRFTVESMPSARGVVWGLQVRDSLGPVCVFHSEHNPSALIIAGRVEFSGGENLPDGFFYDIRMGFLLLGVDDVGTISRPVTSLNPGTALYLSELNAHELISAISRIRRAVTYFQLTLDKILTKPLPTAEPQGPVH